jgi:DnaA-homolog protein
MQQLPLGVRLQDRATFASFLVGDNAEAVASLKLLALPGSYGIVFLYGPPGSGKSHLLQAFCAEVARSAYFPLAQLQALGPEVFDGADALSALAVDGIESIAGLDAWERRLFNLYNECEARRARLVISAVDSAAKLNLRLADLRSRLAAHSQPLTLLDEAQQRQALQLRAALRGLELPEETAVFLQRRFPRDMTTLNLLLDRLDLASLQEQRRLTVPFIRSVVSVLPATGSQARQPDDPAPGQA